MGVRILADDRNAALYCSTSDVTFGPVFYENDHTGRSAYEEAEAFLEWLPVDARRLNDWELLKKYNDWLNLEPSV